jgi:hypothetical protein
MLPWLTTAAYPSILIKNDSKGVNVNKIVIDNIVGNLPDSPTWTGGNRAMTAGKHNRQRILKAGVAFHQAYSGWMGAQCADSWTDR